MPSIPLALLAAMGFALSLSSNAIAQQVGSQEVVQALPSQDSQNLNAALARLGRNPRDIDALLDAGNAALSIGDVDAAIGFFSRADQVMPGDVRVKAGLASALVRNGNPVAALPLFDEAEQGGAKGTMIQLDRGLAFDLVGDNASAQRLYRQILGSGPNDEASRRLGLSLAISGDKRGSATTLTPLLQKQDKAAWRSRAFALAILGQTEDAVSVVNATLPSDLAQRISPYLRYMPRLTKSQQAAAANFGQFPRASEIGLDDPAIAAYAASARRTGIAAADTGLIPKGEPLGRNPRGRAQDDPPRIAQAEPARRTNAPRVAPPDPMPGRNAAPAPLLSVPGTATPLPAKVPAPPAQTPPPVIAAPLPQPSQPPVRVAVAIPPPVPQPNLPAGRVSSVAAGPPPLQAPVSAPPPGANLSAPRTVAPVTPAPAPVAAGVPSAAAANPVGPPSSAPVAAPVQALPVKPRRPSLAEAFGDFSKPAVDAAPAEGAVDLRRIRPSREVENGATGTKGKAAADAASAKTKAGAEKPATRPSHPSRIWVQVATGRDKSGLAYDWRRMAKDAEAAFKGRRPWVSSWNQTNRLLAGPFESESAANAFITQLRRANVTGSFVWTSPAGQVVDALTAR